MDKLSIQNEMLQFDKKNRKFYDELTDEEKKKFSPYLMIRWGSSVKGSRDLQEFYVIACNERLNKHFFSIKSSSHKKLQWLCATTVSPDIGKQDHQWISPKKKDSNDSAIKKQLSEIYPNMKADEIEVLSKITTQKEITAYLRAAGQDTKK